MIIEFIVVDEQIATTKDKQQILENANARMIFASSNFISEKSYSTISRIVKAMLIARKILNNDTRLLKRIIQHNNNEQLTNEKINEIDTELLMLEQAISVSSQYENDLFKSLTKHQNANMN